MERQECGWLGAYERLVTPLYRPRDRGDAIRHPLPPVGTVPTTV